MSDEILLVSADDSLNQGFIRGNSTTAIIVEALARGVSEEEIVDLLAAEYDAPREVIADDVREVLAKLEQIGAIQENGSASGSASLEDELKNGGRITYRVTGDSMLPLIQSGSDVAVIVSIPEGQRLNKYDVALYKRPSGQYVLHRVIGVNRDSYVVCGDNRYFGESGVTDGQILGVLECVLRDGERIMPSEAEYIKNLKKHHRGRAFKGVIHELKRRIKK
jgi:hypothetical protein